MTQWSELFVEVPVTSGIAIFVGVCVGGDSVHSWRAPGAASLLAVRVLYGLTRRHSSAGVKNTGLGGGPPGSRCRVLSPCELRQVI